jgi:hypothetical protein
MVEKVVIFTKNAVLRDMFTLITLTQNQTYRKIVLILINKVSI